MKSRVVFAVFCVLVSLLVLFSTTLEPFAYLILGQNNNMMVQLLSFQKEDRPKLSKATKAEKTVKTFGIEQYNGIKGTTRV